MTTPRSRYKQNRLQQLRGFYHAARMKRISKAAVKMHLSQPSVSLQIKALEEELGTQLFVRRGPRIELTHDGPGSWSLPGHSLKDSMGSSRVLRRCANRPIAAR